MNKLLKIDCIMYKVEDPLKAAEFYVKVPRMKKMWEDKEANLVGLAFSESDSEIVLHNDPAIPNYDFSFLVDNVEEFCRDFKNKGYKIKRAPSEVCVTQTSVRIQQIQYYHK